MQVSPKCDLLALGCADRKISIWKVVAKSATISEQKREKTNNVCESESRHRDGGKMCVCVCVCWGGGALQEN